jgi:hypothetical protein
MAETVWFCWDDGPVGPVKLYVPDAGEIETHLSHLGCSPAQITAELIEEFGPEEAAEILAEDTELEVRGFVHPVWWVDSQYCPAVDGEAEQCRCGRFCLSEVLGWITDPETRQLALDAHQRVMTEAFDHYWAGDAFHYEHLDAIGAICSACFTDGEEHIAEVGGEAETLAEELGSALAAHHTRIALGEKRYLSK